MVHNFDIITLMFLWKNMFGKIRKKVRHFGKGVHYEKET